MSEPPTCPRCGQPFSPLSDRDRQALALACNPPWLCPRCFALWGVPGAEGELLPIESVKAQERAHCLAVVRELGGIATPQDLGQVCDDIRRDVFGADSPVRYAWRDVAPELLRQLWEVMERIGGAVPPRPRVVVSSKLGHDESYLCEIRDALGEVVRWCEAKAEVRPAAPDGLTPDADVPGVTPPRPCYYRDQTWLRWANEERLKPAAIRDRWNHEHPQESVGDGESGRDLVKKGLAAARRDPPPI